MTILPFFSERHFHLFIKTQAVAQTTIISMNPSQAATVLDFVAMDFQKLPVERHLTAASGVYHLKSWESKFNVPTDGANVLS